MRRVWLYGAISLSAACGAADGEGAADVPAIVAPTLSPRIVGGTPSTSAQDAVVYLNLGQGACTGTLVASTLVLTARHCVAQVNEVGECGTFGAQASPSSIGVQIGVQVSGGQIVARGKSIFVTQGNTNGCSNDIALVELDRAVNAPTAKIRLTRPTVGESALTAGYGDSGNGQVTAGRYQRAGLRVLAVGPGQTSYQTQQGQSLSYNVPNLELATGESTCYGDSGGPLFDAQGAIIGVTSRGIDQSCVDRPSIYSGTAGHDDLIKSAFAAVGVSLDTPTPDGGAPGPSPGGSTSSGGGGDPSSDPSGGSQGSAGDEPSGPKTTRKPLSRNQTAASGCSAARGSTASGAPFSFICALAVLLTGGLRRRKDRTRR